jgi:hypothetical protein
MAAISFVTTAFISAFLLFQVQPFIGKALLPWFGGTPLVWTTCMMFFQTLLLLGYAYAHLVITRLRPFSQWLLHLSVMASGFLFAPLLPHQSYAPTGAEQPTLHLIQILVVHAGVPFFALSATAPLVQAWFRGRFRERSPYPLYAVSNAGSLAGVLSYPFVIEPLLPLSTQGDVWRAGYLVYMLSLGTAGFLFWRGNRTRHSREAPENKTPRVEVPTTGSKSPLAAWLILSACGVVLLLATTDQISQDVAATPLFWVVPLCLYLLSFILCFAEAHLYCRQLWLSLLPIAVTATGVQLFMGGGWSVSLQLGVYAVSLFIGCMVAHGELAALKPAAGQLTRYYLVISIGGAAGGVLVAVVAPLLFPDMWEYALGWVVLYSTVIRRRYQEVDLAFLKGRSRLFWLIFGVGWMLSVLIFLGDVIFDHREAHVTTRTFFGRVAVFKNRQKRCLYHGRIRHGCQWNDPAREMDANTYYGPDSGINVAHRIYRRLLFETSVKPIRIGVLGLGVGTAAIFGQKGDHIRFFELDAEVLRFAQTHFSYLSNSPATTDVIIGDGRLSLEKEAAIGMPRYDILTLDAFQGDAIPLHLLTKEAFQLYWKRLKQNGLLVVNISNRHVRLIPLMLGLSKAMKKRILLVEGKSDWYNLFYSNSWIIMTDNQAVLDAVQKEGADTPWPEDLSCPILFTDQYSNLLSLL